MGSPSCGTMGRGQATHERVRARFKRIGLWLMVKGDRVDICSFYASDIQEAGLLLASVNELQV